MSDIRCPECAGDRLDAYCATCGQRQPRPGDFSLRRLATDAWEELTGADGRTANTLRAALRPGELTAAFLAYRWQRYLPPLRLYLIVAGIYFLVAWDVHFSASVAATLSAPAGTLPPGVRELFLDPALSERTGDLTALMKFFSVPLLAGWIGLLCLGRRRPFAAHLVFALHYATVDFALFTLLATLPALAPPAMTPVLANLAALTGTILLSAWTVPALRRVHGFGFGGGLWRGLLVVAMDLLLSVVSGQAALAIVLAQRP